MSDDIKRELAELRLRTLDLAECVGSWSQKSRAWVLQRWIDRAERRAQGVGTMYCSFCGESQHNVRKLIAGQSALICDKCVVACPDIVSGKSPATPENPGQSEQSQADHPDDLAVNAFAAEMRAQMALSRAKGRSGWETCPVPALLEMLRVHVDKGDPVSVANFAMMIWHNQAQEERRKVGYE